MRLNYFKNALKISTPLNFTYLDKIRGVVTLFQFKLMFRLFDLMNQSVVNVDSLKAILA